MDFVALEERFHDPDHALLEGSEQSLDPALYDALVEYVQENLPPRPVGELVAQDVDGEHVEVALAIEKMLQASNFAGATDAQLAEARQDLKQLTTNLLTGGIPQRSQQLFVQGVADGLKDGLRDWLRLGEAIFEIAILQPRFGVNFIGNVLSGRGVEEAAKDAIQETINESPALAELAERLQSFDLNPVEIVRSARLMLELAQELAQLVGAQLPLPVFTRTTSLIVAPPSTQQLVASAHQVIDKASPALIEVLSKLVKQVGPYHLGFAAGMVLYEVLEAVVLSLATAGASLLLSASKVIAKVAGKLKRFPQLAQILFNLAEGAEKVESSVSTLLRRGRQVAKRGDDGANVPVKLTRQELAEEGIAKIVDVRGRRYYITRDGAVFRCSDPCQKIGDLGKGVAPRGITGPLSLEARDTLREQARNIWQQRTGRRAIWDGLQVHHRIPLEWSHLFPNAGPNRIANLVGLPNNVHTQVTNAWNAWRRGLGGRTPTQAEVIQQALRIDEQFGDFMRFLP